MAKNMATKKKNKRAAVRKAAGRVGTGIATGIAAAIVGGYLLYKHAEPHRRRAKAWVAQARKEAAQQVKKMKRVGAAEYGRIVEKAVRHAGALYEANAPELKRAAADMKSEWKHIQAEVKKAEAKKARR